MDELRTILDSLEGTKLDYVMERAQARSDADAIRAVGIARSTFYAWSDRENLNLLAQRVKREFKLRALRHLEDAAERAAEVKVRGLDSRKESIAQATATEILDRIIGKPTQPQEHTGKDGGPIQFDVKAWAQLRESRLREVAQLEDTGCANQDG